MWKIGKNGGRLERFEKEEIKDRIMKGESIYEVAKLFNVTEHEILKVAGIKN